MRHWRRIYPLSAACAVLVTLTITGCPGRQSPVDTSQRILVETGSALAQVDRIVAGRAEAQGDAAIERAAARVDAGECEEGEERGDCIVRHVRDEMAIWYRLTSALEAAHGTLETWEQVNDGWRSSGERPPDWNERVCVPVRTMVQTVLDLLGETSVDVPETWRALIEQADELCSLGVAIADVVAPREEPTDEP